MPIGDAAGRERRDYRRRGAGMSTRPPKPTSFVNGRYEVKRLLGEGGKKRVHLAHDTTLDRDVAFALIKTEGLSLL